MDAVDSAKELLAKGFEKSLSIQQPIAKFHCAAPAPRPSREDASRPDQIPQPVLSGGCNDNRGRGRRGLGCAWSRLAGGRR